MLHIWKVPENQYHGLAQALSVKLDKQNHSVNGCVSTKPQVIMTKGLCVLALLKQLIIPNDVLFPKNCN